VLLPRLGVPNRCGTAAARRALADLVAAVRAGQSLILALITAHLFIMFHQKHTQMPAKGNTEKNVVGQPFFPYFLLKGQAWFFFIFGALVLLATFAQINPVWLYGPYTPLAISAASQPDWDPGILDGALRIMPARPARAGRRPTQPAQRDSLRATIPQARYAADILAGWLSLHLCARIAFLAGGRGLATVIRSWTGRSRPRMARWP
jgi:hypothetical protein